MVHVITGDGKGKTTAAFGLALRCAGRNKKVKIIQFLKCHETGEVLSCSKISNIEVLRFETKHDFYWKLDDKQKETLQQQTQTAFAFAKEQVLQYNCDMLILDEVFAAISYHLIDSLELMSLLRKAPREMEVVLTGRNASDDICALADYVSEIISRKHPYEAGIKAREGIEF